MTYWATLWYAGAVVFSMGYEGQTLEECEYISNVILSDITREYQNPDTVEQLRDTMFPSNEFSVTCEIERMQPHEKYAE